MCVCVKESLLGPEGVCYTAALSSFLFLEGTGALNLTKTYKKKDYGKSTPKKTFFMTWLQFLAFCSVFRKKNRNRQH